MLLTEPFGRLAGALISPAVKWIARVRQARMFHPEGTVYRGPDGFKDLLTDMSEDWDDFSLEADEVRDIDDTRVLVLGRILGRGKASGTEIEAPAAWVCDFRDRKVAKVQFYAHEDAARDELGLD